MEVDFSAAFLPVPMPDFEFVFPVRVVARCQSGRVFGRGTWARPLSFLIPITHTHTHTHTHIHTHFGLVDLVGLMFIPIIHIIRIYF
jgi:hypothetical protein